MRNERYRELERHYKSGSLSQHEYFWQLQELVDRGQAPGEMLLPPAKDLFSRDELSFHSLRDVVLKHEPGLAQSLHPFPARETAFEPTIQRVGAWYLVRRYTDHTGIIIPETADGVGQALRLGEHWTSLSATITPDLLLFNASPADRRPPLYKDVADLLQADAARTEYLVADLLIHTSPFAALRHILGRPDNG